MRRIQLYLESEMDDELAAEAARQNISKAALIRNLVRSGFQRSGQDPVDSVIGTGDGRAVEDIDSALYGAG
ncbi:MAG: CopG family transcriptional regulator [Actinomycetota bacterium]